MNLNTRQTRLNLYQLRRQYGGPVTIYRLVSSDTTPETGVTETEVESYDIRSAVILPGKWSLQEKRGISLISANKQLVQGGQYEIGLQDFIVDSADLPFRPTTDDWLVYGGKRFNFAAVDEYEDDSSWLISARALSSRAENQHFHVYASSLINVVQGVTHV